MSISKLIKQGAAALTIFAISFGAQADGHGASWDLVGAESKVAFGSVKAGLVGESHRFNALTGKVNDHGEANIEIDLTSVSTGIEIRDTRMNRHVFNTTGTTGTLNATVDPKVLTDLEPGATTVIDVVGKLMLGEKAIDVNTQMFVAKLSAEKVMVTTDEMVMVTADQLGVNAGIDKLMELAKLPSIARVIPVTLRLVFETSK